MSIKDHKSGALIRGCTFNSHNTCGFNSNSTPSSRFLEHCVEVSVNGLTDGGEYKEVSLTTQVGEGWQKVHVLPCDKHADALVKTGNLTSFDDHYRQFNTVGVYEQQVTLLLDGNAGSGQYISPRKGERQNFPYGVELSNSVFHVGNLMKRDLAQYAQKVYDADKITRQIRSHWLVQAQRREGCRAKTCQIGDRFDFTA